MSRWLVALCALATGCASEARRGHLVIAGGGTKADNAAIYSQLVGPLATDAVIGVVPTASASTSESAASSAGTISAYAAGRRIEPFEISVARSELARDAETVRRLGECSALWFTGGVQSRIVSVFRPGEGDTPAFAAAREVLNRGGVIGGTSAGAAMMSDPMITGGTSEDALLGKFRAEGEEDGFGIGKGMGFFPYGLTDQHFLRRGRFGRLVVALERAGLARGYGVEENSAIVVDLSSDRIEVVGKAVLVDISSMRREGASRRGIMVSLLNTGDSIDGRTGVVTLAESSTAAASGAALPQLPSAWSAGAMTLALERLARSPRDSVELQSPAFALKFRGTDSTRVRVDGEAISVVNAALDITPKAAAGGGSVP